MGLDKTVERVYDNAARGCASSREPSGFRVRPGGSFLLFEGWCFGRRGVGGPALRPAPPGRWLRLGPRSVPRLPLLGPTSGPPLRLTRWAHGQPRPLRGRGPLSPARAPSGPLAGRSWVVAVARFRPPARRAPRRPWRRLSPFAAAGPPLGGPLAAAGRGRSGGPSSGAGGASLCSARAAFAPGLPSCFRRCCLGVSPSPPPVPLPLRGRGRRKRLTPAAAGTGGGPPTEQQKSSPPPVAPPPGEKEQNTHFVQLCIWLQNLPSML